MLLKAATRGSLQDFRVNQFVLLLMQAQWLESSQTSSCQDLPPMSSSVEGHPPDLMIDCSPKHLKGWTDEVKEQEASIAATCRNALNPDEQMCTDALLTSTYTSGLHVNGLTISEAKDTEHVVNQNGGLDPAAVIIKIGNEYHLNEKQWVAFRIIAEHFVHKFIERQDDPAVPLTMLMTGPGGTGKTHIVKAVQAVMEYYGYGHIIHFLAPTGSAVALIDGMTVHKGLSIKIKSNSKGKGNRIPSESSQDYSVIISIQSKTQL
ncbi:uncharacterized protein F5891DRAFT_982016 [Suillus fuscotomentosus]|uniref:DNA helicase n=1 Tax=Suillus fuscotomentosus TaxID=1912939 RepID=A0AAD4E2G8_9AGAM|nr:uncharacterized protein F5891DRAFT_982016 [Suillus fuscotomentosus]KAG1898387.1 hypothetical protein F5891DRAFT_982016 [Suillus fuscotomentosus]